MTVDAELFVASVRARFSATPGLVAERAWVAGRALEDGSAVILYRGPHASQVMGRRWTLEELAASFSPNDAQSLAAAVFSNEIGEPDGPTASLAVDWADGLVEDPAAVGWIVNRWTGVGG